MLLTVIVPVYNEVRTVDALLRRVVDTGLDMQVVVIDDGSNDGTAAVVEDWAAEGCVDVLRHEQNRGKGAAIRSGLQRAGGRFTIVQDADLEYDPRDFAELLAPLVARSATVVYGSRWLSTSPATFAREGPFAWGVTLLNALVRLLYGVRLTDEATCYKAMPTALLQNLDLQCEGFEFCAEVTAKLCRLRIPIREVPIHYQRRTRRQGKKLRLRDGWTAVCELWRWRNWSGPEHVRIPAEQAGGSMMQERERRAK